MKTINIAGIKTSSLVLGTDYFGILCGKCFVE